jgi:hypothetical protein
MKLQYKEIISAVDSKDIIIINFKVDTNIFDGIAYRTITLFKRCLTPEQISALILSLEQGQIPIHKHPALVA